jgi:hypothetical protein
MFLLNPFVFAQSQSGFALDPAKIKLLLHFDGSLVDSSPNNHTMTSGGNVSISTSEPKFGSGKLQFGVNIFKKMLFNYNNSLERKRLTGIYYPGSDYIPLDIRPEYFVER